MADVHGIRDASLELKDDLNPTTWVLLGYEGKEKIRPRIKGTGEADEFWAEFLAALSDDEILFALLRIVMGDAESSRPKFVFVCWLGSKVGMMKKARVGMQKSDVKKEIGAVHCDLQTDAVEDLALQLVKTKLKKSMGADYDMGSNSRSADGKQGNADSDFAPTEYKSQQSEIKRTAAASYAGGETVKISGGIGSLEKKKPGSGDSCGAAAGSIYECVKKSQVAHRRRRCALSLLHAHQLTALTRRLTPGSCGFRNGLSQRASDSGGRADRSAGDKEERGGRAPDQMQWRLGQRTHGCGRDLLRADRGGGAAVSCPRISNGRCNRGCARGCGRGCARGCTRGHASA